MTLPLRSRPFLWRFLLLFAMLMATSVDAAFCGSCRRNCREMFSNFFHAWSGLNGRHTMAKQKKGKRWYHINPKPVLVLEELLEQMNFLTSFIYSASSYGRAFQFDSIECNEDRFLSPVDEEECPSPRNVSMLPLCANSTHVLVDVDTVCHNEAEEDGMCLEPEPANNCDMREEGVSDSDAKQGLPKYNVYLMIDQSCTYEDRNHCTIARYLFFGAMTSFFLTLAFTVFASPVGTFYRGYFTNNYQRCCYAYGGFCCLPNISLWFIMLYFGFRTVEEKALPGVKSIIVFVCIAAAYVYYIIVQIGIPTVLTHFTHHEARNLETMARTTLHAMLNLPCVGFFEAMDLNDEEAYEEMKARQCLKCMLRTVEDIPQIACSIFDWYCFGLGPWTVANFGMSGIMIAFYPLFECLKIVAKPHHSSSTISKRTSKRSSERPEYVSGWSIAKASIRQSVGGTTYTSEGSAGRGEARVSSRNSQAGTGGAASASIGKPNDNAPTQESMPDRGPTQEATPAAPEALQHLSSMKTNADDMPRPADPDVPRQHAGDMPRPANPEEEFDARAYEESLRAV